MKIFPLVAAAAVAFVAMPAAASAAPAPVAQHVRVSIGDRHHGHGGWHRTCHWTMRHHHRVRVCTRSRW